jgi:hypothetical protein
MNDNIFNIVYYGIFFFYLVIGIIAVLVSHSRFKINSSEDELRFMKKKYIKWAIVFFVLMILLPMTIIILYIISLEFIHIIQFFILYLTVTCSLISLVFFLRYWSIRKCLRNILHNDKTLSRIRP